MINCTRTNDYGIHLGTIKNCTFTNTTSPALTIGAGAKIINSTINATTGDDITATSAITATIYRTNYKTSISSNITNTISGSTNQNIQDINI